MSDLHLEFERRGSDHPSRAWFALQKTRKALIRDEYPNVGPLLNELGDIDLVILAGDVNIADAASKASSVVGYAGKIALYLGVPVLSIADTHDFCRADMNETLASFRQKEKEQRSVRFLEQGAFCLTRGDERLYVLGTALRTNFALFGDAKSALVLAGQSLSDFRQIKDKCRSSRPKPVWNATSSPETG